MVNIEIFLNIDECQVSFLSIPSSDIERLVVFPFRWMRYVMFAICGARGVLSTIPNGPPVDYDRTELVDTEIKYYYQPFENCAFVDYEGLNDRLTSTAKTPRSNAFRNDIIHRDGPACVVTQVEEGLCQAAHLIPHSKGDEYIARVIQLRSAGDYSASPSNVEIDHRVNGILLNQNLHTWLGKGEAAFIKTPNYGLRPQDIRAFRRGDSHTDYITFHRLKRPKEYDPTLLVVLPTLQTGGGNLSAALLQSIFAAGANVDALFQGDGVMLPSTVILDYVYGVAAYKTWHSNREGVPIIMNEYRKENYAKIPPLPRSPPDDTEDNTPVPDDPTDTDYNPTKQKHYKATTDESELARAMDELNMFLMCVTHGITPEEAAERRQKKVEQEEQAAQEASQNKVMEWKEKLNIG